MFKCQINHKQDNLLNVAIAFYTYLFGQAPPPRNDELFGSDRLTKKKLQKNT